MKRSLKLLLLMGLFNPLVVNAATVSLDCPSTTSAGVDITCNIKINSSDKVAGFEANINASNGLTYKSYTRGQGWSGTSSSNTFLVYGNEVTGENVLGTYTYAVGSSAIGRLTVTLNNITVSDTNGDTLSSNSTASDTIAVLSNINTLSNLIVSGTTINFSPSVTTYNIEVDSSTTMISASATDSSAKINGIGTKNLNYGANKFDIVVTAENGSTRVYTLNITRKDNRSTDNTLKELKLNNGTINFKSGTTNYNVTIDSDTTIISATANDKKATVTGTGTKKLNYGVNKFNIIVTAENGSTRTYTLNITRKDNRSNNTNLSSLTLSEGKISFDKNKTNYEISVENKINEIKIGGKAEDSKSKVEGIGTKKLEVGENKFIIKVTAENGSVKEYKVVVIRDKEESITANNQIKNLTITGYELKFDANTKDYVLKTDKQSLDIKVELENSEATYEIIGNEDLHDGSIIQIIVTDKEGKNNIYSITIKNPNEYITDDEENIEDNKEEKNINYIPIIMVIILGLLLVVNIVMIVIKVKKRTVKLVKQ